MFNFLEAYKYIAQDLGGGDSDALDGSLTQGHILECIQNKYMLVLLCLITQKPKVVYLNKTELESL